VVLAIAFTLGALVIFAMWWLGISITWLRLPFFGRGAPLPPAHIVLIALVAGLVGGIVANLLRLGLRRELAKLRDRLWRLEHPSGQRAADNSASDAADAQSRDSSSPGNMYPGGRHFWQQGRIAEGPAPSGSAERLMRPTSGWNADTHGPNYRLDENEMPGDGGPHLSAAMRPSSSGPPINDIVLAYGKIATGHLSRSAFQSFFSSLGPGGPVDVIDGGQSIRRSEDPDAFLISADIDGTILVFPSYSFVANRDTQFSTIASVPDNVALLFALTRGSGEIVVASPAVFSEREGVPTRERRGEIKGFAG
jgi:hypothetical protein